MENLFVLTPSSTSNFLDFVISFLFDLVVIFIIAKLIYYSLRPNRDYLFTFFIFNIVVFFVCYLLNSLTLSLGFAFGIFAIFSILRYRTETVPIIEMTYMFISISIAMINAIINPFDNILQFLFVNGFIVVLTFIIEKVWVRKELRREILYEKIELIKPERYDELIKDLKERTGLDIHRIEMGKINFLNDTCLITVFYQNNEINEKKR